MLDLDGLIEGDGCPPFDTGGAECVYNAANAAAIDGGFFEAPCPE